jgi:hypothetical protein
MLLQLARLRNAVLSLTAVALLASCANGGGDDDDDDDPIEPPGSVAISVSSTTVTLTAGDTRAVNIAAVRAGTFAGAVPLTVTGAPSDVTAAFTPATIAAGTTTSTLTLTTTPTTAARTFNLTVSATGLSGGTTVTASTIAVTVNAASPGSIAISAAPTTVPVVAGGAAGTSNITITRTAPFAGAVALALSAPTGLTVSATPATGITGTTAVVSAQAAASLTPGTYPVMVTASGTGVSNVTATVNVVVAPPVSGSGTKVEFCADDKVVWVAQQNGTGAWTRVMPTATDTYIIDFSSGTGGLATVGGVGRRVLNVVYLTATELTAYATGVSLNRCGTKSVLVPTAAVAATDRATISIGRGISESSTQANPEWLVSGVAAGNQVLIGTREPQTGTGVPRLLVRRDVDLPRGSTSPTVDFASTTEAFAPESSTVTLSGLIVGEENYVGSYFTGIRGAAYGRLSFRRGASSFGFFALPSSQLKPDELQAAEGSTFGLDGSMRVTRSVVRYFRTAAATALTLPPRVGAPTLSRIASVPHNRVRMTVPGQTEFNQYGEAVFTASGANRVIVMQSAAYLGGAPSTWDLQIPDLSGVNGWMNDWLDFLSGVNYERGWQASLGGGTFPLFTPTLRPGDTNVSSTRNGI